MANLHEAVRQNLPEKKISRFLKKKGDVNLQEENSLQSPLHIACQEGFLDLVKFFVKKGSDPNLQDSNHWTSLHCAASGGYLKVVEFLLGCRGINVQCYTLEKTTVLHYLVRKAPAFDDIDLYRKVFKQIVAMGLDVNMLNLLGEASIHSACMRGNFEAVLLLLESNADVNVRTMHGETGLHYAVRTNNLKLVRLLASYGANPAAKSESGQTPIDIAIEYKQIEILNLLEDVRSNMAMLGTPTIKTPPVGRAGLSNVMFSTSTPNFSGLVDPASPVASPQSSVAAEQPKQRRVSQMLRQSSSVMLRKLSRKPVMARAHSREELKAVHKTTMEKTLMELKEHVSTRDDSSLSTPPRMGMTASSGSIHSAIAHSRGSMEDGSLARSNSNKDFRRGSNAPSLKEKSSRSRHRSSTSLGKSAAGLKGKRKSLPPGFVPNDDFDSICNDEPHPDDEMGNIPVESCVVTEDDLSGAAKKLQMETEANITRVVELLYSEDQEQAERSFCEEFLRDDFKLVAAVCDVAETAEEVVRLGQEFPGLLIKFFETNDRIMYLLNWAVSQEVRTAESPFRMHSLYIKLVSTYFQSNPLGIAYLKDVLQEVKKIASLKHSLEVDPAKAKRGDNVKMNLKTLLHHTDAIIRSIFGSVNSAPLPYKEVLKHAAEQMAKHFPSNGRQIVGSVFFLRFVCPAIVNPRKYGVVDDAPTDEGVRALVLMAKYIQLLANQVEMDTPNAQQNKLVNEFIHKHIVALNDFYDEMTNPPLSKWAAGVRFGDNNTTVRTPSAVMKYFFTYLKCKIGADLLAKLQPYMPADEDDTEKDADGFISEDEAPVVFEKDDPGEPFSSGNLALDIMQDSESDAREMQSVVAAFNAESPECDKPEFEKSERTAFLSEKTDRENRADRIEALLGEAASQRKQGTENQYFLAKIVNSLKDAWTSHELEKKKWPDEDHDNSEGLHLIDTAVEMVGFHVELGSEKVLYIPEDVPPIEDPDSDTAFYTTILSLVPHLNFMCLDDSNNPVIVSVEKGDKQSSKLRCLVRLKERDDRFMLLAPRSSRRKNSLYNIRKEKHPLVKCFCEARPQYEKCKIREMDADKSTDRLVDFERRILSKNYKFGVLLRRVGQNDEEALFANTECPSEFYEFLEWLGTRVTLKGFQDYRGGLDVKQNTTGTESIYTSYCGHEIMFHVAPMLPFMEGATQQLERKRHLGNDVVLIIFNECDGLPPFSPGVFFSHFNHVFMVVQPVKDEAGQTEAYQIAVANKEGVRPYGPPLPFPAVFKKNEHSRNFLLSKLINGERAAMAAPGFVSSLQRTRNQLLSTILKDFTLSK
mmetsp:Transcript_33152/g.83318  ORF Transcript_33152/g.83318 Transcript_33152/m.83318 type:complete len:1318 (-) Transcript_33152:9-3962(-)